MDKPSLAAGFSRSVFAENYFGDAHRAFRAANPPAPDPTPYPLRRVDEQTINDLLSDDPPPLRVFSDGKPVGVVPLLDAAPTLYAVRANGDIAVWPRPAGDFPALFVGPCDPGSSLPEPGASDAARDA